MPEVAPKNQTGETFAPDYLHRITFGGPPRNSIPMSLVAAHEVNSMLSSAGRFEGLKRTIEMTNEEIYKYLKLGVSTQSASFLKWMGYETPESLTESPETSALLPDHLGRCGVEYPLKLIELCEQEGVSAVVCQMAVRRGATDRHLDGVLPLRDMLYAFTNLVKKNVTPSAGADQQPSVINYVCDGTIPLEIIKDRGFDTQALLAVASEVLRSEEHKELAEVLRGNAKMFATVVKVIERSKSAKTVSKLAKAIQTYGYEVLEMSHPLLCFHKIGYGEERTTLGYHGAQYVESFLGASPNNRTSDDLYYSGYSDEIRVYRPSGNWYDSVIVTYLELYELYRADIDPVLAYAFVVGEGMPVASLISASQDGVENSLMSGAL